MAKPVYSSISIIYNPIATGPAPQLAKDLRQKLLRLMPDVRVGLVKTKYKYHAIRLAQQLAKDPNALIIYTGGDGGYHELVNGVMKLPAERRPIVAVNPAGNANDHHRTVIGSDTDLADLIQRQKVKSIDLLSVAIDHAKEGRTLYAHSYVGLGSTGRVAKALDHDRQQGKRFVRVRQAGTILRELASQDFFRVQTSSGARVNLKSIIAASTPEMAMVLKLNKGAQPTDNTFALVVTPAGSRRLFLKQVAKAALVGLTPTRTHNQCTFTLLKGVDAQLDGEVYRFPKGGVVTIKSQPKVLKTLV